MNRALNIALLVVVFAGIGCAGSHRLELVQRMNDDEKEMFSKYKQFMTEGQEDDFLALPTLDEKKAYIAALKIEERVAKYPKFVQDAIWSQEVVPGMDREAVLLTWSIPMLREWDEAELAKGNEVERWSYRRMNEYVQVVIANGVVTRVVRADAEH